MDYAHTQHGPLWWILALLGVVGCAVALSSLSDPVVASISGLFGAFMLLLASCFGSLTVTDEGPSLLVRFGPLPLARKRVAYDAIESVEVSRSSFIDGWGIHYVPGRGWTYNLWGTECVVLNVNGRTIRIGSDDSEHLAWFIRSKIGAQRAP